MSQGASSIYEVITHNPEGPERTCGGGMPGVSTEEGRWAGGAA